MAFQVITANSIGTGVRVNLGNDDIYVGAGVIVARTDVTDGFDFTILATGSQHRVDVAGTVLGTEIAIQTGDEEGDAGNVVNIAASGVVRGYEWGSAGVRMSGRANLLINAGDIWAANTGVIMFPMERPRPKS